MKPLVSIIIPVCNGENYLKEAIDSALAQTYENTEILVINDGSEDKTEEIALSYGGKVRYFAKENGGVSSALNAGLAHMRGEYFSWLSHDDLYGPEKIEREIEALSGTDAQIVYSDYSVIDKDGTVMANMKISEKYRDADLTFGVFPILSQVLNGCSLLIHKSLFERAGVFNEHLRVTQDYDLWFRMLRSEKLVYVAEPLVMQREHGAQVTHSYEKNLAESDGLWLGMLKSITKEEACKLSGNEREFWDRQTEFLRYTRYMNAKAYSKSRLSDLGGGKISFERIMRRTAYAALSGISRLIRVSGLQRAVRKSRLFNKGYMMWFGVRYR